MVRRLRIRIPIRSDDSWATRGDRSTISVSYRPGDADPVNSDERRCAIGNSVALHGMRSFVTDLGYLQQLPALALLDRMPVPPRPGCTRRVTA